MGILDSSVVRYINWYRDASILDGFLKQSFR